MATSCFIDRYAFAASCNRNADEWIFLRTSKHPCGGHFVPRASVPRPSQKGAAPLGMKAPCALCHEIGAYSAACTTVKIETKEVLWDGREHVLASFAFCVLPNSVPVRLLGSFMWENRDLQEFCSDAPRHRSPLVSELPHCRSMSSLCVL